MASARTFGTARPGVRVAGLRELLHVTDRLGKEARKAVRNELRAAAVPLRDEVQRRYNSEVGVNPDGKLHARYGISIRKTGVVSVEQRIKPKHRGPDKYDRPKFNELQWEKALTPAVNAAGADVDRALNQVYEKLRKEWVFGA